MKHSKLAIGTIMALVLLTGTASAEKGGKHKSKDWEHTRQHYNDDDDKISIYIGGHDRDIIREHIRKDAFRHCPPGLAKKNPPCVPPGQANKYRVGYPLPHDVVYVPIDWNLRPPAGYQYVRVDKDVLLISEASKKVIDAVTLLSAVGN